MSFEELQKKYVAKMYELAGNKTRELVNIDDVGKALGLAEEDATDIWQLVLRRGWIDARLGGVAEVTSEGRAVVSDYMEKTYAEEERIVVETAVRLSKKTDQRHIFWRELEAELPKLSHSLRDIVNDLEDRKLFLHEIDEGVRVGPKGYEFVENQTNRVGNISVQYGDNISADRGSVINFGNNSNVTLGDESPIVVGDKNAVSVNPEFDSAIKEIRKLVKASNMSSHDMAEAIADLETVVRLATARKDEGIIKRAMAKIASLDALLNVGGLAVQAAPYIEHLLKPFN